MLPGVRTGTNIGSRLKEDGRVEREILEHELKVWIEFFDPLASCDKPFEIRQDDRDYRVGDILFLREWDHEKEEYTGREIRREVTYRADRESLRSLGGALATGIVVLGIRPYPGSLDRTANSVLAEPRYRLTPEDWTCLTLSARHSALKGDRKPFACQVNIVIHSAEQDLRRAVASDLRSLKSTTTNPLLVAWVETLAVRYERGEELT
jgi:hypothetical protein